MSSGPAMDGPSPSSPPPALPAPRGRRDAAVVVHREPRFLYFVRHTLRLCVPAADFRRRLDVLLRGLDEREMARLHERVAYCNKLSGPFALPAEARPFRLRPTRGQSLYQFDLHEHLRRFDPRLRVSFLFGDVTTVPATPTLVKSRPLGEDNRNSVLLKLNRLRHFIFVSDRRPFAAKLDQAVWRGRAYQKHRQEFLQRYHDHPRCDVGHYHRRHRDVEWVRPRLGIAAQLRFKFVVSIEGQDVASNLKWILSSNSLCLMRRPRHETWFMEGLLVPGRHYVLLRDDHSDLIEKMDYYAGRPGEALAIIREANRWAARFRDPEEEERVGLLVLWKYFHLSGQLADPPPCG